MADVAKAQALLEELRLGGEVDNWRAKWSQICETFWAHALPESHLQRFIDTLKDRKKFELARLVVPDLRVATVSNTLGQHQQRIVDATAALRREYSRDENISQAHYDDPAYATEKQILLEAEVHRASILLHYGGAFDNSAAEDIRAWLQEGPRRPG